MNLIPMVVEQDGRGERAFDIYSRLLKDRIIFLGTAIDDNVAVLISVAFAGVEKSDPEIITNTVKENLISLNL